MTNNFSKQRDEVKQRKPRKPLADRKKQVVIFVPKSYSDVVDELIDKNPAFKRMSKSAVYRKLMAFGTECVRLDCEHFYEMYDAKKESISGHIKDMKEICIHPKESDYRMIKEKTDGLSFSCVCNTILVDCKDCEYLYDSNMCPARAKNIQEEQKRKVNQKSIADEVHERINLENSGEE